jgi:hypothetical protein
MVGGGRSAHQISRSTRSSSSPRSPSGRSSAADPGRETGVAPGTTSRPAEEASNAEPQDVTRAAAAGIDESSIRTHLARLTGVSPASLGGRQVTISERGSKSGRRTAAE